MQIPSAIALTGFIAWTLALLVLMELLRTRLVILGKSAPNEFLPDNANLSLFMQRLARAHANCVESLPVFGGLLVVALVTMQTDITDKLAYVLLASPDSPIVRASCVVERSSRHHSFLPICYSINNGLLLDNSITSGASMRPNNSLKADGFTAA